MSITDKLIQAIAKRGRLSYAEVVEVILYDPEEGYYRSGKPCHRDFLTSPELSPVFGRAIGAYVEQVASALGFDRMNVVELGGASGELADALEGGVARVALERYVIVEKGHHEPRGVVQWVEGLGVVPRMKGFTAIVANEFFDALPFHRIKRSVGSREEVYVGYEDGFFETPGPPGPALERFLERYPVELREGQALEVTPVVEDVVAGLNSFVEQALLLVFDYGYHSTDIAAGLFPDGSVVGYRDFMLVEDILREPGSADATHHVSFDLLADILARSGWRKRGEMAQYRFLLNAGVLEALAAMPESERLAAKSLIDPRGLGSIISVLAFTRGIDGPIPLFSK